MQTSPVSENWDDLLITKLSIPALNADMVHRERLINSMNSAAHLPLILLTAPTGYGKTTLLVEWFSNLPKEQHAVVWMNLDAFDNTPIQFWSYVILGCKQSFPAFKFSRQQFLQYGVQPENVTLLNPLLNEIARLAHPVFLVLDDYQVIQDETIHRSLEYLIDHQPVNLHLILSSRTTPPLRLARQQAQRRLIEFTTLDLSFTYPETSASLSQALGPDMQLDQLEQLHQATKGWIAGLQLAALSLKSKGSAALNWTHSANSLHEIKTYLIEEVLSRQDAAIHDFLMRTSILSEFCPDLCDAVLEQSNSLALLQQIEQANLFITVIDRDRPWYRYHPLFASALQTQLKLKGADSIHLLHRRAYTWLRASGYTDKAISHALAAGDAHIVADILEEAALNAIVQNDLITLVRWTQRFTPALLHQHPHLGVYDALAQFFLGQCDLVRSKLRAVEILLNDPPIAQRFSGELQRYRWEMDSILALMNKECRSRDDTAAHIQALIEAAPAEDAYFTGFLANALAILHEDNDELDAAIAAFHQSHEFARLHNLPNPFVHSQCNIAHIYKRQGRLSDAEEAYQLALQNPGVTPAYAGSRIIALTGLLEIAFEQNHLEKASAIEQEIFSLFNALEGALGPLNYQLVVLLQLANYKLAQGDLQTGSYYFQRAAQEIQQTQEIFGQGFLEIYIDVQVRLWILARNYAKGAAWLTRRIEDQQKLNQSSLIETVGLAKLALAQGEAERAFSLLKPLLATAHEKGMRERALEIHILQALALWAMNQKDNAFQELKRALHAGQPEGYVRIFINEGEPMKALLQGFLAKNHTEELKTGQVSAECDYAQRLTRALQCPDPIPASDEIHTLLAIESALPEPLSLREAEVLMMLLTGKSVKEIATHLAITTNTARAHIRGIHRKMNVHSRMEVYQRAKDLNLIR